MSYAGDLNISLTVERSYLSLIEKIIKSLSILSNTTCTLLKIGGVIITNLLNNSDRNRLKHQPICDFSYIINNIFLKYLIKNIH